MRFMPIITDGSFELNDCRVRKEAWKRWKTRRRCPMMDMRFNGT